MKIALFGGSFNPIHNRHLEIIKQIQKSKIVDEIWILPCGKHSFGKELASKKDRVEMIKLGIKGLESCDICYEEIDNEEISITIDTVQKLKKKYDYDFCFIIGSDILGEIKLWNEYKELFKELSFIIVKREGFPRTEMKEMEVDLVLDKNVSGVSSSEIRERVRKGEGIRGFVPLGVEEYIERQGLYGK